MPTKSAPLKRKVMNKMPSVPLPPTYPNEGMKTSDSGVALVKKFEGCRLRAYTDVVGVWTIGYGHTRGVREGQEITQEQADAFLKADLETFEKCITSCVTVKLTQMEFDALVSFAFNVGCANLKSSTLLKLLNAGDRKGAAGQFYRWNHAGGQIVAGLTRRRMDEKFLFEGVA